MSTNRLKINKGIIYIASFILITVISLFYKLFLSGTFDSVSGGSDTDEAVVIKTDQTIETTETITIYDTHLMVSVYICGQINAPGVYEVEAGSILNDVVQLAGGLTAEAAVDRINLVYTIDTNVSVYIPSVNETIEQNEFVRTSEETIWGGTGAQAAAGAVSAVNINNASAEQLMSLPGIGEVTANAIIEYREQTPFERVEDIMNVPGIGEAKFNGIRDLICV